MQQLGSSDQAAWRQLMALGQEIVDRVHVLLRQTGAEGPTPRERAELVQAVEKEEAGEWRARRDENSGCDYYYHTVTGETSWTRPEERRLDEPEEEPRKLAPLPSPPASPPKSSPERTSPKIERRVSPQVVAHVPPPPIMKEPPARRSSTELDYRGPARSTPSAAARLFPGAGASSPPSATRDVGVGGASASVQSVGSGAAVVVQSVGSGNASAAVHSVGSGGASASVQSVGSGGASASVQSVGSGVASAAVQSVGTGGATGHVLEYAGSAIRDLDMEGRMTVCNMAIEMTPHISIWNCIGSRFIGKIDSCFNICKQINRIDPFNFIGKRTV